MKTKLKILSFIYFLICLTSFSRGQDLVVEKTDTSSKKQSNNNSEKPAKIYVSAGTVISIKNETVSKNVEIVYVEANKIKKSVEKKSSIASKKEVAKSTPKKKTEEIQQETPLKIKVVVNQSYPTSLYGFVAKNTIATTNHQDYSKAKIHKIITTPILPLEIEFVKQKISYQKFSKIKKGFYETYAIRPPPTSYSNT